MAWQTETIRGKSVDVLPTHSDGGDDYVIPKFYLTKRDIEFLEQADQAATDASTTLKVELQNQTFDNGKNAWDVYEPFTIVVVTFNDKVVSGDTIKELTGRVDQLRTEVDDHESRISTLESA